MVSMMPYTPRFDNTHMFAFTDSRGCLPKLKYCDSSIMGHIENNPDLTKIRYLIKLAKLDANLNHPQANVTIFVPSDAAIAPLGDSWCVNADLGWAMNLVKTSMVNRRITADLLTQSPAFYLLTRDDPNRLFITNINGKTLINNNVSILQEIPCSNGIILVTDKVILPTWPYREQ
jgi:uncharacterized surface protein with fasciclin (FAS1) repeats